MEGKNDRLVDIASSRWERAHVATVERKFGVLSEIFGGGTEFESC